MIPIIIMGDRYYISILYIHINDIILIITLNINILKTLLKYILYNLCVCIQIRIFFLI